MEQIQNLTVKVLHGVKKLGLHELEKYRDREKKRR
jgi:hypothetical protein